ncbi:hypothetical protein [Alteribacillus bidgolensis]|nr:hypothetical protein [Alteribacillus bidgolensis]
MAPNGNAECRPLSDDPSYDGWVDHEQLKDRLGQIDGTSNGRVGVDVVGYSQLEREIFAARVGTGDRVLLVTSKIHGNEKTGTEALLQMLKTLGSSSGENK